MKTRHAGLLAVSALALLAQAGCASSEQWQTWRSHSTHFASGQHAVFSFRNQGTEAERVRRTDPDNALEQSWWGRQLPIASEATGGS